jgi:ribitol 2-dehydrogenase
MTAVPPVRVGIVTGASSGIGRACAMALDAQGMRLVVIGRDLERLNALVPLLTHEPIVVAGDVSDPETTARARDLALEQWGRLDVLLANAGLYLPERGWEVPAYRIDTIVRTNVLGVMHAVHAVIPHFVEQGIGDIVVTSSVSGHQVIAWEPIYSSTKHAVQAFVHGTRQQLIGTGIRLGEVAPGIVLNELWGVSSGDGSIDEEVSAGRGMRSEDVAEAVLFMLGQPRHITIRDLVMLPTNQPI